MLVLGRKKDQRIFVEVPPSAEVQTIELMVSEIKKDQVRLSFHADPSVKIYREEIYIRILQERQK